MKAKHQRLTLALLAMGAVLGASLLALSGLRDQASFFYSPSDLVRDHVSADQHVRLGGMVVKGSIRRHSDGVTTQFRVTDNADQVEVSYRGILPDLFREGSGVVAEGRLRSPGHFVAETILAKHDARYMPPQVAGAMHKSKSIAP